MLRKNKNNKQNKDTGKMIDETQNMKESQEIISETDKNSENVKQETKNQPQEENQNTEATEVKVEVVDEKAEMQKKYDVLNDKYLRLYADFDNYRKRTLKEKMDLIKTAGEDLLVNLLPVVDNFERALLSVKTAKDIEAVKEGIELIYSNFKEFISQKGIKEIEAVNKEFNTDVHEAVTKFAVQDELMKGKVVDVITKGYYLHDKVIRYAKVVVGE